MSEPSKKPDPPKKPEVRPAGAPPKREDVFRNPLPNDPVNDPVNDSVNDPVNESAHSSLKDPVNRPDDEKITLWQALSEKANKARRKSMQLLGITGKERRRRDK